MSLDEEPLSLFQDFARNHPPCGDDICALPTVATQLSNHTTLILAMTNMDIRVPFDEAYVTLVGTAVYLFFYYEWTVIYVIDLLEPGFLPEYCRHPRGITSGKHLMHLGTRAPANPSVSRLRWITTMEARA